jgi:hypothetical protein
MQCIEKKKISEKFVETYRSISRKSGGNYLRAAGHGVLDVCTLGLWEVAGTPIESSMDNNRGYIIVRAVYANDTSENVEAMEIFNEDGKRAKKIGNIPQ